MKFCDEDGFGPFLPESATISPCFSEAVLEPMLYIIFLVSALWHSTALKDFPVVLAFRHSMPKFKLKVYLSALQAVYPIMLSGTIILWGMKSSYSYARFISYALRSFTWGFSSILTVREYKRALPMDKSIRLFWMCQLMIDFFACLVPHGGDKVMLRTLSVMNFLLSASLPMLNLWEEDIRFSLFKQNKEKDENYFWDDFHDTKSRSRSTTPEKDSEETFLLYGLDSEKLSFDNIRVNETKEKNKSSIWKQWVRDDTS